MMVDITWHCSWLRRLHCPRPVQVRSERKSISAGADLQTLARRLGAPLAASRLRWGKTQRWTCLGRWESNGLEKTFWSPSLPGYEDWAWPSCTGSAANPLRCRQRSRCCGSECQQTLRLAGSRLTYCNLWLPGGENTTFNFIVPNWSSSEIGFFHLQTWGLSWESF